MEVPALASSDPVSNCSIDQGWRFAQTTLG
jgi:hypothetical protein